MSTPLRNLWVLKTYCVLCPVPAPSKQSIPNRHLAIPSQSFRLGKPAVSSGF